MMRYISLPEDPKDAFPFSQAVLGHGWVHVAGQLAADDAGWPGGDIEAETEAAMRRIGRVLERAGAGFGDIVRVGIFMTDLGDFDRMNAVYRRFFPADRLPARTCVGVAALLSGGAIEIDCIARLPAGTRGETF